MPPPAARLWTGRVGGSRVREGRKSGQHRGGTPPAAGAGGRAALPGETVLRLSSTRKAARNRHSNSLAPPGRAGSAPCDRRGRQRRRADDDEHLPPMPDPATGGGWRTTRSPASAAAALRRRSRGDLDQRATDPWVGDENLSPGRGRSLAAFGAARRAEESVPGQSGPGGGGHAGQSCCDLLASQSRTTLILSGAGLTGRCP